jgi:very-short-patch-repair endonuclease
MTPIQDRIFLAALAQAGIPAPVAEYKFHPIRKWRMDFAWPEHKVFLEVDGGLWVGGRHTRAPAMLKTWEKENTATTLGWRILRCQPRDVNKQETINLIQKALCHLSH